MRPLLIFITTIVLVTLSVNLAAQKITTIDPPEGEQGTTLNVTISGQNTNFGQGSQTVYFNQGSSTLWPVYFYPLNDQAIQAQFSIFYSTQTGYWDVNVYNDIDGHLIKSDGFLVKLNPNQPMIVKADPDSAKQGDNLSVTISGQNTNFFAQGTQTVWFTQGSATTIYPVNVNIISNTQLDANFVIPIFATPGYYDINTYDTVDGYLIKPDGFKILPNTVLLTELEEVLGFEIFPNPVVNTLFINIQSKQETSFSISVFDLGGRTIFNFIEKAVSSSIKKEIDMSDISPGTYFLRISSKESSETKIIIKE